MQIPGAWEMDIGARRLDIFKMQRRKFGLDRKD